MNRKCSQGDASRYRSEIGYILGGTGGVSQGQRVQQAGFLPYLRPNTGGPSGSSRLLLVKPGQVSDEMVEGFGRQAQPRRAEVIAQPISEIVVCERLFRSEGLYPQALNTSEVIAVIGEHGQAMPERCCPDK